MSLEVSYRDTIEIDRNNCEIRIVFNRRLPVWLVFIVVDIERDRMRQPKFDQRSK